MNFGLTAVLTAWLSLIGQAAFNHQTQPKPQHCPPKSVLRILGGYQPTLKAPPTQ